MESALPLPRPSSQIRGDKHQRFGSIDRLGPPFKTTIGWDTISRNASPEILALLKTYPDINGQLPQAHPEEAEQKSES